MVDTQYTLVEIINECSQLLHPYSATTMIYDGMLKKKTVRNCLSTFYTQSILEFHKSNLHESNDSENNKNNSRHLFSAYECSRYWVRHLICNLYNWLTIAI